MAACGAQKPVDPITNITWQWVGLVETQPASQSVVPNPENYTLTFLPDGSLSIKADCNMASGTYALEGNTLSIELGATTMAYCGEQSMDQQYLANLGNVAGYIMADGQLVLALKDTTGKMTFK